MIYRLRRFVLRRRRRRRRVLRLRVLRLLCRLGFLLVFRRFLRRAPPPCFRHLCKAI